MSRFAHLTKVRKNGKVKTNNQPIQAGLPTSKFWRIRFFVEISPSI
jgi:hypothetical protein